MPEFVIGKDFDEFEALLSKWKGAYVCAVHSYVAIRTKEGLGLLSGRVFLAASPTGLDETRFRVETEHVVAGHFVNNSASYDHVALIMKAREAKMDGLDGPVSLGAETQTPFTTHFSPVFNDLVSPVSSRVPSLRVSGQNNWTLLQRAGNPRHLDWELKAARDPFDTLDELLTHCGLPSLGQGGSTTIEIIASIPAAISEDSVVDGDQVVIRCRVARSLDVRKLRIGYRILGKGMQARRGSVSGDTFDWSEDNNLRVGSRRLSIGDGTHVQAFLSYDDIALHQWWIVDEKRLPNPRHAIHQAIDKNLDILRKLLFTAEGDKSHGFEDAISTLLTLLGFSVANYGRVPKLQDGPDIIATTPTGNVAIVECTLDLLDKNDKLGKLVKRTKSISEKLAEAGHGHIQLQAVIITQLPRAQVSAHIDLAGRHGIAVVCREHIEQLLNRTALWPNADRVFQEAKSWIPAQPSPFEE